MSRELLTALQPDPPSKHPIHFLLSRAARTLSIEEVFAMSNDEVLELFHMLRWPDTKGEPVCPSCGSMGIVGITNRSEYRCKSCERQFSLTGGTFLHGHKLPLKKILLALLIFADGVKSMSALQWCRTLDMQYRTAYVIAMKLREGMMKENEARILEGNVEGDAAYCDTVERKPNEKAVAEKPAAQLVQADAETADGDVAPNAKRKRKCEPPIRRCVMVIRQRSTEARGGATRTVVAVIPAENGEDVDRLFKKHVALGATVSTDQHPSYSMLSFYYDLLQVNHSERYSGPNGENINQAESFFARLRRMQIGQMHHFDEHLLGYAVEAAWRDDYRRRGNGENAKAFLSLLLGSDTDHKWRNFCRYTKRRAGGDVTELAPVPVVPMAA